MSDEVAQRRVSGRLLATYVMAGLALVAGIVFVVASFAVAFGQWRAGWAVLLSAVLMILALTVGIIVSPFTRPGRRPAARSTPSPLYRDIHVSRGGQFALGVVATTGELYLAIPGSNGGIDAEERYRLTPDEYAALARDEAVGARFADRCRRRELDDRLLSGRGE